MNTPTPNRLRVGVLTGGGDCPGLNAVIRAVTRSLIRDCQAQVLGFEDGFAGLGENRVRPLDWQSVGEILAMGGTVLGTSNRANPLASPEATQRVLDTVAMHQLDAIVAIGGDGTMSISAGLAKHGLQIVGVPKTIDNDIEGCERSFGFDTAVAVVTDALERLHTTGQSHGRTMILETMGRYSGWIALEAGIAGSADVILLPEFDYHVEEVARICRERERQKLATLICVAEGAKAVGGELTVAKRIDNSPDPLRLGGVAHVLQSQLQPLLDHEVRATVLGHVQRGGSPTPFDRVLATQFGVEAAALVERREFGRLVTLVNGQMNSIPLGAVAGRNRKVPHNHPLVLTASQVGISFGQPI
ncbi:MAG: hypothetical protein RLZZ397_123 [Pseudomonadota bacterium]|jgi:6-phosphofructokinase 1